jgi:hypothetical protein
MTPRERSAVLAPLTRPGWCGIAHDAEAKKTARTAAEFREMMVRLRATMPGVFSFAFSAPTCLRS